MSEKEEKRKTHKRGFEVSRVGVRVGVGEAEEVK
jgi:hypothetical protein